MAGASERQDAFSGVFGTCMQPTRRQRLEELIGGPETLLLARITPAAQAMIDSMLPALRDGTYRHVGECLALIHSNRRWLTEGAPALERLLDACAQRYVELENGSPPSGLMAGVAVLLRGNPQDLSPDVLRRQELEATSQRFAFALRRHLLSAQRPGEIWQRASSEAFADRMIEVCAEAPHAVETLAYHHVIESRFIAAGADPHAETRSLLQTVLFWRHVLSMPWDDKLPLDHHGHLGRERDVEELRQVQLITREAMLHFADIALREQLEASLPAD